MRASVGGRVHASNASLSKATTSSIDSFSSSSISSPPFLGFLFVLRLPSFFEDFVGASFFLLLLLSWPSSSFICLLPRLLIILDWWSIARQRLTCAAANGNSADVRISSTATPAAMSAEGSNILFICLNIFIFLSCSVLFITRSALLFIFSSAQRSSSPSSCGGGGTSDLIGAASEWIGWNGGG